MKTAAALKATFILVALAAVLFTMIFSGLATRWLSFWTAMGGSILLLSVLALAVSPELRDELLSDMKHRLPAKIFIALLSAIVLYFVFWFGKILAFYLIPNAEQGVASVYGLKSGATQLQVAALMIFIFGPGEEIFWRGFVQKNLVSRFGTNPGVAIGVALYGLVHLASLNAMLILAALVCGSFWAVMYARQRSLAINIASHTFWDLIIFLIWPLS